MRTDSDATALIHGCELEVTYGPSPVLRGVSITVRRGQSVAVVGPNGAGKSTLLNTLCGVISPRRGAVSIDGRALSTCSRKEVARMVAVVPQKLDIGFGLTVQDVVSLGRTPHIGFFGSPGREDRGAIARAMDETDIRHLAGRRFSTLSGGEQQRAVLAMALAQETRYLLLDEPTVHLDLGQQWRLMERIRRLRESRRVGVLAIVHDLTLAGTYFDEVVLLHHGRVAVAGRPSDVLTKEVVAAVFDAPIVVSSEGGTVQVVLNRLGRADAIESIGFVGLPQAGPTEKGTHT